MTGTQASMAPMAVKPSSEDRWGSWKIQTRAPNVAPSEITFMISALTGIRTEPVIRNSSAKVAVAISASAHGSRCAISALKSARKAACPVTQVRNAGRCSRDHSHRALHPLDPPRRVAV